MRYLSVFFLLLSCGKYESTSSARLGQRIAYEPQELNQTQVSQRESICAAISAKTARLGLMHGSSFSFTVSEKNCAGENSQAEVISVKVEVSDNAINFQRDFGHYFIFKDAETLRSGVFKSYCQSEKTPFMHNGNPVWMDVNQNEFCAKDSQSVCVNFKSGLKEPALENTYKIMNQETFKLDSLSTSPRYGFYTERTLQSSVSCESGNTLIKATLN